MLKISFSSNNVYSLNNIVLIVCTVKTFGTYIFCEVNEARKKMNQLYYVYTYLPTIKLNFDHVTVRRYTIAYDWNKLYIIQSSSCIQGWFIMI